MSDPSLSALKQACQAFADRPGHIAVIVQSKSDPAHRVAINPSLSLPSASLIKIAIACAAATETDLDLAALKNVADLDPTFYCSIIQAFEPSDQISLKALIGLMLIVSDNPATSAVLDAVGLETVNAWLKENGLSDTTLSVGFDDASLGTPLRANLTSAEDCLSLLKCVEAEPEFEFIRHMLRNNLRNERIPRYLPDSAVIAHKTGTLNGLMHDIAIIESPEVAFYLIILADSLPEDQDFAGEIARFSKQVYDLMVS